MKQDVKVSFYLKKNQKNKDNHSPVMAQLFVGKSATVFSTKMDASASLWSSGRVLGKSSTSTEINRRLDGIRHPDKRRLITPVL